jgi:dTDP-4-amino-4,6-dideoxygalactose transaminase
MGTKAMNIPFNKPYLSGLESEYISKALSERHLIGNGSFTRACHKWLETNLKVPKALLTPSCTDALEMAALLLNLKPGDEVIMPSFTFVSTANAVVLRGATPVFVDIRPDTLNIDEKKIEQAITKKTRAIFVVHYAGISCHMNEILKIADQNKIFVVEDAAHGILARYHNRYLGAIGHISSLSFHGTKNIVCGEGGAALINDPELSEQAEIIWEKGTNRSKFFRGLVDKYTWVEVGSSYLPSEVTAAFLLAQLEKGTAINARRLEIWNKYHEAFKSLEESGVIGRPFVPPDCDHNAHLYYLILPSLEVRTRFIQAMKEKGIGTVFHYVPLHNSPAGLKFGRTSGKLSFTEDLADRQVRLPLWPDLTEEQIQYVIHEVRSFCKL